MSDTTFDTDIDLDAAPPDPGDAEPVAHVVRQDELAQGLIAGTPVTAVCGRRFVPRMVNPDLPACDTCMAMVAAGPVFTEGAG